jgi:hypothetical protein
MLPRNSCRVGFKQRWDGEGFEDDEEGGAFVDNDRTVSTDMDSNNNWDNSFQGSSSSAAAADTTSTTSSSFGAGGVGKLDRHLKKLMSLATSASIANNNNASSASLQSSCHSYSVGPISVEESLSSLTFHDRLPFQTLIETGLEYMKRYPPRCLKELAQKYYQQPLHDATNDVTLLQNPPLWSLASHIKADWVLKQRVRQDLGLTSTSRKDRRKKLQYNTQQGNNETNNEKVVVLTTKDNATPLVDKEYLKKNQRTRAVIAAGYGPDPENEKERNRRRKRQRMMAGAVGVVAVMIGVAYQYHHQTTMMRKELQIAQELICCIIILLTSKMLLLK